MAVQRSERGQDVKARYQVEFQIDGEPGSARRLFPCLMANMLRRLAQDIDDGRVVTLVMAEDDGPS
jgi:hypothetical protein